MLLFSLRTLVLIEIDWGERMLPTRSRQSPSGGALERDDNKRNLDEKRVHRNVCTVALSPASSRRIDDGLRASAARRRRLVPGVEAGFRSRPYCARSTTIQQSLAPRQSLTQTTHLLCCVSTASACCRQPPLRGLSPPCAFGRRLLPAAVSMPLPATRIRPGTQPHGGQPPRRRRGAHHPAR